VVERLAEQAAVVVAARRGDETCQHQNPIPHVIDTRPNRADPRPTLGARGYLMDLVHEQTLLEHLNMIEVMLK
jgi:hypothetical protein